MKRASHGWSPEAESAAQRGKHTCRRYLPISQNTFVHVYITMTPRYCTHASIQSIFYDMYFCFSLHC